MLIDCNGFTMIFGLFGTFASISSISYDFWDIVSLQLLANFVVYLCFLAKKTGNGRFPIAEHTTIHENRETRRVLSTARGKRVFPDRRKSDISSPLVSQ